jgi:hypothetical protein
MTAWEILVLAAYSMIKLLTIVTTTGLLKTMTGKYSPKVYEKRMRKKTEKRREIKVEKQIMS